MACTVGKETNRDVLHCKIYFDMGRKTNRQSKTPKLLDVKFQWFETPFQSNFGHFTIIICTENVTVFILMLNLICVLVSNYANFFYYFLIY